MATQIDLTQEQRQAFIDRLDEYYRSERERTMLPRCGVCEHFPYCGACPLFGVNHGLPITSTHGRCWSHARIAILESRYRFYDQSEEELLQYFKTLATRKQEITDCLNACGCSLEEE